MLLLQEILVLPGNDMSNCGNLQIPLNRNFEGKSYVNSIITCLANAKSHATKHKGNKTSKTTTILKKTRIRENLCRYHRKKIPTTKGVSCKAKSLLTLLQRIRGREEGHVNFSLSF